MLFKLSKIIFIVILIISCGSVKQGKKIKNKNALRISYYNADAFYDTIPSPLLYDTLYTPESIFSWNTERYNHKLENISKVIYALHDSLGADIVGLTGIETEKIVEELIQSGSLPKRKYQYGFLSCENSYTGLGKAVLYNPKKVTLIQTQRIPINITISLWNKQPPDALLATFAVKKGKDTFQILISDFDYKIPAIGVSTSKRLGPSITKFNRIMMGLEKNSNYKTMFMGTFYIEASSVHFQTVISSINPNEKIFKFAKYANLHLTIDDSIKSATFFDDFAPKSYDHIHLNTSFFNQKSGWQYTPLSYRVFNPIWLQHIYPTHKNHPLPVFYNKRWIKGYSQHFPVSFLLDYAKKRKSTPQIY